MCERVAPMTKGTVYAEREVSRHQHHHQHRRGHQWGKSEQREQDVAGDSSGVRSGHSGEGGAGERTPGVGEKASTAGQNE